MKGWKVTTVGDDIAWIKPGPTASSTRSTPRRASSASRPGTSETTNPNAMATIRANTIFTNVALTPDGDVWWEGMTKEPPRRPDRLAGPALDAGLRAGLAAHPNARFTAPARQCPSIDAALGGPAGRADQGVHLRRPPQHHRAAGLPVVQLDLRRLHGRDDGLRDDRRGDRAGRRGAPRSDGDAAVLRLPHGRLLQPLAAVRPHAPRARRASSPSTGSARMRTAASSGPASARTCACCAGSSSACRAGPARSRARWAGCRATRTWTGAGWRASRAEQFATLASFDRDEWKQEILQHDELFIGLYDRLPKEMPFVRGLQLSSIWRSPEQWGLAPE